MKTQITKQEYLDYLPTFGIITNLGKGDIYV